MALIRLDQKMFNAKLRAEVDKFSDGFRKPSSAFLIWYLVNFFRLEEDDAKRAVCDEQGDKGIDGILVDNTENYEEVYIFQSKFSPNDNLAQGDVDLREFAGVKTWFDKPESVRNLQASSANYYLKSLLSQERIAEMVGNHCKITPIFITNKRFDRNAKEFLQSNGNIDGQDIDSIFNRYSYISEEESIGQETTLALQNPSVIQYQIEPDIKVNVFSIQAKELLKLGGIRNGCLFSKNVRFGLGNTRVNKDITATLKHEKEHIKFFLYHNGITITCEKLRNDAGSITISNYSVVNGCQSVLTFYQNAESVSSDIYVLTKIIELPAISSVSVSDITLWTNNQNAISIRDLKANDRIQISLKREFDKIFNKKVLYRRQRGDSTLGYDEVIDLDFAAQLIAAFYLGEPYMTYVGDRLFTDRYSDIFSARINAAKIYMAKVTYDIVEENCELIKFKQIRNYGLAKFFMIHVISKLLQEDKTVGPEFYRKPDRIIKGSEAIIFKESIKKLFELMVLDADNFIEDWTLAHEFFDYKNFFKNKNMVDEMAKSIVISYKKNLVHHPEESFGGLYRSVKERYGKEHFL